MESEHTCIHLSNYMCIPSLELTVRTLNIGQIPKGQKFIFQPRTFRCGKKLTFMEIIGPYRVFPLWYQTNIAMQWKMGAARIGDLCISFLEKWGIFQPHRLLKLENRLLKLILPQLSAAGHGFPTWKEPYIFLSFETVQNPRFCRKRRVIREIDIR